MLKKVIIGIVVLAALGGATLFVLDRTLFAPTAVSNAVPVAPTIAAPTPVAPTQLVSTQSAPTKSAQPVAIVAATAASSATLYHIDATQSEARYEVSETFFQGNRLNLAIGRTKAVAGDISIDLANPAKSQLGDIVIDISQLKSDESRRDNFIRNNGLESARYPQATFKTTSIEGLPAQIKPGDTVTFALKGDLTVKQTTKPVTWQVTAKLDNNGISGTAITQIKMSDFGVGPIQIAMLATEDTAKLVFDFVATAAQN